MAVTSVGTPSHVHATTGAITTTWGTGQQPAVAGNLMVAVVTSAIATAVANTLTITQTAGTSGWTQQVSVVNGATTTHTIVTVWTKVSAGSDTAPQFTGVTSGTTGMDAVLFNLAGANLSSIVDTSGTYASGNSSLTLNGANAPTATSSQSIANPGEFAIAVFNQERTAGNLTWTDTTGGWSSVVNGAGVSSVCQTAVLTRAPTAGATVTEKGNFSTATTAFASGAVIAISAATSGPPLASSLQAPSGVLVSLVRTGVAMASLIPAVAAVPPPPPTSGPPFTPFRWPVQAQDPLPGQRQAGPGWRGRVYGISAGGPVQNPVPPVTGPVFYPARQAVRARLPQPPAGMGAMRGRVASSPPAPVRNPVPGPRFIQKAAPVRYVLPPWKPRAGRIGSSFGAPVINPRRGPPFYPFTSEVRAAFPQQPLLRGRAASNPGAPVVNPNVVVVSGAVGGPVRASLPANPRGRVRVTPLSGTPGTPPVHAGPPFFPFTQAVRARRPLLPLLRGRTASAPGAPVRNPRSGAAFPAWHGPAQARIPLPPRGRCASNPGGPVRNPVPVTTGPVFRPATSPARIRPSLPQRGGWTASNPGGPVRNPGVSNPPSQNTGQPAGVRVIFLAAGRTQGSPGGPVQNPPPPTSGPVFRQATTPARIRPVLPRRGTVRAIRFYPLPANPGTGPAFRPATSPAQARIPQNAPRGRIASNPGGPVRNPAPGTTGPVFYPRNSAAPRQPLPRRGTCRAIRFYPAAANPTQGPAFRQATAPVQARHPLPPRGRIASSPGGPVQNPPPVVIGPPFRQATSPARIRPSLPPRGRVTSNPGAPVRNPHAGPPVYAPHGPVRAPVPQVFSKGRVTANPGGPVVIPVAPAPVYPLHGPVMARRPLPPHGRVITGNPGAPVRNPHHGAVFHSLPWPARTRIPQNAPRGRASGNPGGPVANIPFATLLFRLGSPYFQWDTETPGLTSEWSTGTPVFSWAAGVPETSA